ncbi:MAG: CPBP family intramembrane metalloprotease [Spirochaetes bacterium]|nr:CPBP family intramembrane metalloprotease [Spirochaetota bacterium]
MMADIKLPLAVNAGIAILIGILGAGFIFPRVYKIPFGAASPRDFLANIGLGQPKPIFAQLTLGILISVLLLGAMLVASLLTGRYSFDPTTINWGSTMRALNAGIFEEIFFRGILTIILLHELRSLPKAILAQSLIFGLLHIKVLDGWGLFDAGYTVVLALFYGLLAIKSGNLWLGIIVHVIYDTFLFAVQTPGGLYNGLAENALFFGSLTAGLALASGLVCLVCQKLCPISPSGVFQRQ